MRGQQQALQQLGGHLTAAEMAHVAPLGNGAVHTGALRGLEGVGAGGRLAAKELVCQVSGHVLHPRQPGMRATMPLRNRSGRALRSSTPSALSACKRPHASTCWAVSASGVSSPNT